MPCLNQTFPKRKTVSQALSCERYSKLLQILSLDNLDFDTAELGDLRLFGWICLVICNRDVKGDLL